MTKSLESLLNVQHIERTPSKDLDDAEIDDETPNSQLFDLTEYDKISAALPAVRGLGKVSDRELNEIALKAVDAYDDLMDLGMNVEQRYSGRIFEVANSLLKTGLDAKVAKMDKKLKMIELQLKQEKQEEDRRENERRAEERRLKAKGKGTSATVEEDDSENEQHVVSDRNSLLNQLRELKKNNSSEE